MNIIATLKKIDELWEKMDKDIYADFIPEVSEEEAVEMVELVIANPEGLKDHHVSFCKVLACYYLTKAEEDNNDGNTMVWYSRHISLDGR